MEFSPKDQSRWQNIFEPLIPAGALMFPFLVVPRMRDGACNIFIKYSDVLPVNPIAGANPQSWKGAFPEYDFLGNSLAMHTLSAWLFGYICTLLAMRRYLKYGEVDNQQLALVLVGYFYYNNAVVHCLQAGGPEGADGDIMHAGHLCTTPAQAFCYCLALHLGCRSFESDGAWYTIIPRVVSHPALVAPLLVWQFVTATFL